ncbi:MAG: glycoside hydrolase family 5 protein [Fibromonadaceae bacterium]|jgi:endoglucanase|nr:glycoside hydrolase family 5 protein [Fibromonadaceae bacterium]
MKNVVKILIFASVALWAQTNPLNMTTAQVVKDMGLGINLGNTFESNGDWINGTTVNDYETAWGSPTVTKAMIDGYKNAGFKTVRIPVSWTNLMTGNNTGGTYTISTALLNRVEEVVNWVLEDGMYAIVNLHHQKDWIQDKFPTDSAECMRKYTRIWEQVSAKFKDKSGYLILESMNEEGSWNEVWNMWSNSGDKARAYGFLNTINQKFYDVVKASGGNNANRHLLIAGYDTNIDYTSDPLFKLPTGCTRCAVSVHYYDPFGFTHINGDDEWTAFIGKWGTQADITELNTKMNKLKTNFVDKDIPVIIGEYGFAAKLNEARERTQAQVTNYTLKVAEAIYTRNMCPVLWDIQLDPSKGEVIYYYNRKSNPPAFSDPQLVAGMKAIAGNNVAPSSSSIPTSSSSSEDATPIISHSPLAASHSPTYYSLKGEPLGNAKPQKAGIYIVKQGSSIRKIAVR